MRQATELRLCCAEAHLAVSAATSAPTPWKAASSSMDSSSHLPSSGAVILRRRPFQAALRGYRSE